MAALLRTSSRGSAPLPSAGAFTPPAPIQPVVPLATALAHLRFSKPDAT